MQDFVEALCDRLHLIKLDEKPALQNKHGIRPSYVALSLITLAFFYFLSEHSTYWLSMICGLLFPAFLTYKCLEDEDNEDNDDERKFWLTYWIIYGLVEVIESRLRTIFFRLPLYNVIKVSFLIWLQHPSTRGAIVIYEKTLRSILKQHEKDIDEHLYSLRRFSQHKKVFNDVLKSAKKRVIERVIE